MISYLQFFFGFWHTTQRGRCYKGQKNRATERERVRRKQKKAEENKCVEKVRKECQAQPETKTKSVSNRRGDRNQSQTNT